MKLVVFGRTGQLAQALARRAPDALFLDRQAADLADPEACAAALRRAAAEGAQAAINAAAYMAVDRAEAEEPLATRINGEAPGAMAQAAAQAGIPFLQVSSDYVFDGRGEAPHAPDEPVAPLSAYGRSKAAGEAGVRDAGGAHAILRTSWVFSADGGNFVKTMLRLGAERDALRVVDDQIGGPTEAGDIAAALLVIAGALKAGAPSGTWHFAGAPDVSWAGFAHEIMTRAGLDCAIERIPSSEYPTPAARPLNSRLDCSRTEAVFGIARPDWRDGLTRVLEALT
ncbi:dTDP-4-dehydrorhamnose reductase [Rhodobacteraceae bacterium 2CG4]|uniref:dTDP-4-dehydrorhamnose reductase n=1 Tax=Halovulum marinum TaxID=2662447 RepID=A0A6L5Z5W9_9RHOB|nr:dTDP-4-dehydrorhamnose reductase [Halovulum marinum]MSU91729.1 dTDP-4-dehydrorhamnose reductase [Halovulum marinum]